MTIPVAVLAIGSAVSGLLVIPGVWKPFEDWLELFVEPLVVPSTGQEWLTSVLAVALGVLGALLAWRAFKAGRELVPDGGVRTTLEHKLWFDELYDAVFSRPGQAIAVALRDRFEVPVVQGGLDEVAEGTLRGAAATSAAQSGLLRTYALAITISVAVLALVFLVGALMLTTLLIFVPLVGALLVWIAPLSRESTAGLALLVALAEVGLWLGSTRNFDFGSDLQQYSASQEWFEELGISYAVGLYGFQFWLVGLTAVVGACAIGYGAWANRDRARAYFGLMLFLIGSLVGVFASQDLILFYVFFEAMLIPIYVLVGVWGGPGRMKATLTFVLYTMAGSLLMLAAIIAFGISQGTFLLAEIGTSSNDLIFLGFMAAFAVKAPLLPFHGWLRAAYTEAPPEVAALLSGVVSKAAVFGLVWIVLPHFPQPVDDWRNVVLALAAATLVYGSVLAFRQPDARGVIAYSSMGQMGLIVLGIFAVNDLGLDGAILHSVSHGLVSAGLFLVAGMIETRTGTGVFSELGGMAKGRPFLATLVMVLGIFALAVPGSANFAGEFAILAGVFEHGWGYAAVGAAAIVLAALYALRLISAILHERRGRSVRDEPDDLVGSELMLVVPLVAILAVLSAWPAGISERSFPADAPADFIGAQSGEGLGTP